MKNKTGIIILACVLVVSFILGVTGAITFAKNEPADNTDGASKDRLIGVFITTEHLDLFDFESYFQDNADKVLSGGEISSSDSAPYEDKLYAILVDDPYTNPKTGETITTKKYVFDGIEGIAYFSARYTDDESEMQYWGTGGDDAISDAHTGLHSTDAGDSIDMKGTIYVSTSKGFNVFYYNPVYQTATGEVYLMSGQGMSHGGELSAGMSSSHALKEEQTVTIDGKSETIRSNIEVSTCFMDTPIGTSILQFDKDGSVVTKEDYAAGDLPYKITTNSDTEYIIVETYMKNRDGKETVTRELFQPDDKTLFAFSCREDGICVKQYCSIVWDSRL